MTLPRCERGAHCGELDGLSTKEAADWLTRDEWNVCYFLGLDSFHRGEVDCGVCEQVAVGMKRLLAGGYRFERLRLGPSGRLEPDSAAIRSGEHEGSCGEIGDGDFDQIGRARQAIGWLGIHAPEIPTGWLEALVALYDRTHEARRG